MDYRFKAPFPYFGGKSEIADVIWSRLGDTSNYVEGFFGSGAVLLNRPHWQPGKTMLETVNDASGFIANFWRAVQADPDAVAHYADWPVNECVPSGTMIATPDGEIAIENVRPGMIVLGDQNGEVVPTRVVATKQSVANEFFQVGPLLLTGNHPVWTAEQGYLEAHHLTPGLHVKFLHWPVCENDFFMLQCAYEQKQSLGNLHTERSENAASALCWRNVPKESPLQGTSVTGRNWWQDTSGLLDSLFDCRRGKTAIRGNRERTWRRLARSRTALDRPLSAVDKIDQSNGWWRWHAGCGSIAGIARKMVEDAGWSPVCTGARVSDEGQEAHTGSHRKNPGGQQGAKDARQYETEIVCIAQAESGFSRTKGSDDCGKQGDSANRGIPTEGALIKRECEQESALCRNRRGLPVDWRGGSCPRHKQGCNRFCIEPGYSLQRLHTSTPVAVYNFQTTTGNYFANRILVHNCDLHARHGWLVRRADGLAAKLEGDPDYYDPKIAGWWCWGAACWIGSGWCSGNGPWQQVETADGWQLVHLGNSGQGVNRQRVHLGSGQGVNRQLVHLGNSGQGVNRKRVHLGNSGQGVNRKRVHLGDSGNAGEGEQGLYAWMRALSERLARVRVCCGDWSRVCGPTPTFKNGLTAVFLDPPYTAKAGREADLYEVDCLEVGHAVAAWCKANGDNPLLRIALCGYEGEYDLPGWDCLAWKAHGGYGTQGNGRGRDNATKERIWFNKSCLRPATYTNLSLFDEMYAG